MELLAFVLMLAAGGAAAIFIATATAIARKENEPYDAAPRRDSVAASLLFQILSSAGMSDDEALRQVRRGAGLAAPVTRGIDVSNWAESYASASTVQQRESLLETAVQLVAARQSPVPLRQYAALLDLSFGLGFHTDALARLRQIYGFDYVDHAKDARPRSADRGGGGEPLFERRPPDRGHLLGVLGLTGHPTRQELSAAYRKLVVQHHPDRFHGAPAEAQNKAAARFMEITRAYEELLLTVRD